VLPGNTFGVTHTYITQTLLLFNIDGQKGQTGQWGHMSQMVIMGQMCQKGQKSQIGMVRVEGLGLIRFYSAKI
jgi:hypothetical protein